MTSATLVLITLAIVSGLRKLAPKVDGPWLVLGCAVLVGCASSLVVALTSGADIDWSVLSKGATAAAGAFGFASLFQWVAALLPALNIDARNTTGKPDATQ